MPLRAELYSADQMEQHGKALAATHTVSGKRAPDHLLARLSDNETHLVEVCKQLTEVASGANRITPAGEWLLDNFYLIEEQIRTARLHLPKGYSRELPLLANGPSAECPRVYDLALETISHGDGRVDAETLSRFVSAYQTVCVLKLGELWAIPIMLRLAAIENLRRVGVRIAAGWVERNLAGVWADLMIAAAENDPKSLILVIADMARSNPPMVGAFVAELARRLQGRGPALALPLTWIEQRLSESGLTIEQMVQGENQRQAADQVSVSNSIGSLRLLGAIDWRRFVETLSIVEWTLRDDGDGVYASMDFATRDRYRHAIERIAKRCRLSEVEVARLAIQLAGAAESGTRPAHVGYFLIDQGLPALEQAAGFVQTRRERICRATARRPLLAYLGSITVISALSAMVLLGQVAAHGGIDGFGPGWGDSIWLGLAALVVLAVSQFSVALTNWLATLLVMPRPLPRMDLSEGLPAPVRTLVVVPTMLTGISAIEALIEALEVRFLANRDAHLHFGLLTDFLDADQETLPEDGAWLERAGEGIRALNLKYDSQDAFFLFHRPRHWNAAERVWMGYERKRGKLAELNSLLRGGGQGFSLIVGDTAVLAGVQYVITLDTDTDLPRDAARKFVGAMAHPLNRPRFDSGSGRVTEGYGILQPRVAISLPGTHRSRYARLYGGEPGIDPYTRAVSDVYQDVFGEGSFIGKGIYAVDAFEQVVGGRFPENRILSHDLLEGCYARAGLLSDEQLYEDSPARYGADVSRRHRWIRGDWQLAAWLWRRIPGPDTQRLANPLSWLSQWKLFDNLRRSLVPAALILLFLFGWSGLTPAGAWTLSLLGLLVLPALGAAFLDLIRWPDEVLPRQHLAAVAASVARHLKHVVFELACLPYEAYYSLDAIVRTLWRMRVAHRRLLEWRTSSEADRLSSGPGQAGLDGTYRVMWFGPVLAIAAAFGLAIQAPAGLMVAVPILLLWLAGPALAWWISQPLARHEARLNDDQRRFLRALSRRTWGFFDHFVGPEDHWLPPDNYQEYRVAALAHRTSPTNIGLALLANLAAYDFGYLTAGRLIGRTGNTLATLAGLERHRGHFYNWYDTQTLQALPPLYVSTVDSGNLAGHLLTLQAGLVALGDDRILQDRLFDGLSDTLALLAEARNGQGGAPLLPLRTMLAEAIAEPPATLTASRSLLVRLIAGVENLDSSTDPVPESEAGEWTRALLRQAREALEELNLFADASVAIPTLRALARNGHPRARARLDVIDDLARQAGALARMEFGFLYEPTRHLLSIGYNITEHRIDPSYYDLLASEARLSSFVAIAKGDIPQESWFAFGRLLTGTGGEPVLLSWSGSMFEYLMPLLVMPTYDHTLLDQTCKAAVARQIEYGGQRGVPWGLSESGYNMVDQHLNYQYRAFGVPGLGLKRGLAEDLVVAPYATVLALMVAPEAACRNLQRLAADGLVGRFGCFEAIDYTPSRQRRGQVSVLVRSFMAHHQGMSLLALAYLLLDRPMQRRFASTRVFQAILLLLQERIPKATALFVHTAQLTQARAATLPAETPIRVYTQPNTPVPEVQMLSNGRYHVMVTHAGGGYSRWKDLAVTRWHEDGTRDHWGSFCYLREVGGAVFWSTAYQPTLTRPLVYEAIFSEGRAEFRRQDAVANGEGSIESHTEIVVSPEDDIELRRVRLTNRSRQRREIELTSYAEVVLAPPDSDALHPAFSNLFVETEILADRHAILCTRRPRSQGESTPGMLHLMAAHGAGSDAMSFETDRARFIGRARDAAAPLAMVVPAILSGSEGSVLDPIVAIRHGLMLEPDQSVTIDIVTGMAETRVQALALIDKYQDRHLSDRVFELTWTHSQVVLRQLNASEVEAQLYARLASSVIHANAGLRAEAAVLIQNRRGQSGLWGYAISGDLPIVLLRIGDAARIDLVRQLVQAHAYWRQKGLAVDLVIWNEEHAGYRQRLQDQIVGLITSGLEASVIDRPGGIFVRPAEQISGEDRILLQSVARAILVDSQGTLAEQLDHRGLIEPRIARLVPSRSHTPGLMATDTPPPRDLILTNGLGGFTPDGREYIITLAPGATTPAPWVNVLANPDFGSVVSESGVAYTWSENAHEFRLSPWHNDPVGDAGGEALYLRDEETGQFWSPTPLPAGSSMTYVVRHGFGYSVFESRSGGLQTELWVYVANDAAVKFSVLKVRNRSGRSRKLSATGYVEWVLGDLRAKSAMHVSTEAAQSGGTIYARNPYNGEFADRVGFYDVDVATRNLTGDRREFLGRNGSPANPAGMSRAHLSGKVGAGLDPCAAIQVGFELADGQEREIVFRLGVGRDADQARQLVQRFRGSLAVRAALEAVWQSWNRSLGTVRIETPDASVDVLANGWLVYQTLACRMWARSGFYQSGGAYGFRDQLQDSMALVHSEPGRVRAHLLLCASRQFQEGDVQHWWHPPSGRGVRTRCSDDFLWLPLAVSRYVTSSADTGVLDEPVHFLEGRPVGHEDDAYYDLPGRSAEPASLYQHCVRAIRHGLRFGAHGLPLIGSGDWNDSMNRVGIAGRGESVWLGFFLCEVLRRFAEVAAGQGDPDFATTCTEEGERLRQNLERHGWDGAWYRRAYFDDGTPLGSAEGTECQIDSISQSWAVLSGAGDPIRVRRAMMAVDERLVRRQEGLIQLLDPPFDNRAALDPGYIRGYVPGVRENGGQYTHGAIWAAMAFAELGNGERAWALLAMINPVNHALSPEAVETYKVEPYVIAADVYAVAPHIGRGGWSWYTGSAGWLYRLVIDSLLGLDRRGDRLHLAPRLPADWPGVTIHYRYRDTLYHIEVGRLASGQASMTLDGIEQARPEIALLDDGGEHRVVLRVAHA